jgi:hypothetical protein
MNDPKCIWAGRLSDRHQPIRTPRRNLISDTTSNLFTARLTIDVTPERA